MSSRTKPSANEPNGPGPAGRTTNLLSPASTYCPIIRRAPSQPTATSAAGSASGRRRRIEASSASGMPFVRHRQAEPEVVGIHLPPGLRRGVLDHADRRARLGGRQQRAEPPVG